MPKQPKVLGIIPARGQSKRLPGKNLQPLAGKPLLAWTIEAAQACARLDDVILSSDDAQLIACAEDLGCAVPFVRPRHLANDDTPGIAPVLHALTLYDDADIVVLLQPTSPLRLAEDIDACIDFFIKQRAPSVVSVSVTTPERIKNPTWCYYLSPEQVLQPYLNRRYSQPLYQLNGALYVAHVDWLKQSQSFIGPHTQGFVMPLARSVDIDEAKDMLAAKAALEVRCPKPVEITQRVNSPL